MSKTKRHKGPVFEDDNYKSNIVPCDILFCILIRLPVKSLLRFQLVSTSWNALISGYEFKKAHRDQSKSLGRENLLLQTINDDIFELRDLENPQTMMRKLEFPAKRFGYPQALCSCDGLVLLDYAYKNDTYALWNPYTNEYGIIECPYLGCYRPSITPHACGLCYDSSVDDYKVILICKSFYAIGYVNRNYWRKETSVSCKVQALNAKSRECCPGISVDGCVFWSLDSEIHQLVDRNSMIIYFDVKSDELKELPKPDFIGDDQLLRLTSFKGCVGLYGGNTYSEELDVWIMKQHGWMFSMKISCYRSHFCNQFVEDGALLDYVPHYCYKFVKNSVFLGCTRNGEMLFQAGIGCQHLTFIYDPKRHQFVKSVQLSEVSKCYIVPLCCESLYFPKPKRIVWS